VPLEKRYNKHKETLILPAGDPEAIKTGGEILRRGGLVAFPTETVYGLGANALNGNAVASIFEAKGRPADNPLIVHIARWEQVYRLAHKVPPQARLLAERFWPGPLTLVFARHPRVPLVVTAGLQTVAVRMPAHDVALRLLEAAGVPVAAPSANLSGRPSPTRPEDVIEDMCGRIQAIIDGGCCRVGIESTVLDITSSPPVILRPGGLTVEQLQVFLPDVKVYKPEERGSTPLPSPGLKYRHYAPRAPLYLYKGEREAVRDALLQRLRQESAAGSKVGLLLYLPIPGELPATLVKVLGKQGNVEEAAASLFSSLREFDRVGVDMILAEGTSEEGMGLALMDRLSRAAGENVIEVIDG